MIQRISKRFLSLLLGAVMVLALLPVITLPAFAASSGTVTGLSDTNIGLSFSGTADDAWSASGTQIIGKARSTSGSGCGGGSDCRSTLTITNKKTTKATLSFDYTVVVSEGTILVDNTTTTANGSFSKELAAGGTVEVEINSGSTSADTKITMTNVKLVADVSATVTFQPSENGSYTVDGQTITEPYTNTQSSMTAYQVAATPAEGYRFKGWYDVASGKCIDKSDLQAAESLATTYSKILESNSVLNAVLGDLNSPLERKELAQMVDVAVVTNTQLLEVVITSTDANFACKVAESFASVAPAEIVRITKAGGVEVVDHPEVATEKTSPRTAFDTAIAVVVGMIIAAVVIILKALSDTTIYLPEDIDKLVGVAVIGQIPEIEGAEKNYKYWELANGGTISYEKKDDAAKPEEQKRDHCKQPKTPSKQ